MDRRLLHCWMLAEIDRELRHGEQPCPLVAVADRDAMTVVARPDANATGGDEVAALVEVLGFIDAMRPRIAGVALPLTPVSDELTVEALTEPPAVVLVTARRGLIGARAQAHLSVCSRDDRGQLHWSRGRHLRSRFPALRRRLRRTVARRGVRPDAAELGRWLLRRGHRLAAAPGWATRYGLATLTRPDGPPLDTPP